MPDGLVGSRGFQLAVLVYWKWEAFSKNNANTTECVWAVGQARVLFLFAYRDVLIALV